MRRFRRGRRALLAPAPTFELLRAVLRASTPIALVKAVNALQYRLSKLPLREQETVRERLIVALTDRVLTDRQPQLRLEAARWLRLLTQASMTNQPQRVFVTLVTAAATLYAEQVDQALLPMLYLVFECFWPYRYPYATYSWQQLPNALVFAPLVPLLKHNDLRVQEAVVAIFSELPTLDEPAIINSLLPVVLAWSNHADAERRRCVTRLLAHMDSNEAHDALQRLQYDADPIVRASARHAAGLIRRA